MRVPRHRTAKVERRSPLAPRDDLCTIGVLSPVLAAPFFSGIVLGITRAAAQQGVAVVGIQTFDPGDADFDRAASRFQRHVSWERVSGVIAISNAVESGYFDALEDARIPIVMVSREAEGHSCPVVSSDNGPGVVEAVEDLIAHGHERIAFVGNMTQIDIRERYEAYRATLLRHDIVPDENLAFDAGDNVERGGAEAAAAMLKAGLSSTAIVAGTDHTAIGIMDVLKAAGLALPQDQAIVGFDDIEPGALAVPALSSVQQNEGALGVLATELILELIEGKDVPPIHYRVPTHYVPRSSCGCSPALPEHHHVRGEGSCAPIRVQLRDALLRTLTEEAVDEDRAAAVVGRAAEVIADVLEAPEGELDEELSARLHLVAGDLCGASRRYEIVPAVLGCMRLLCYEDSESGAIARNGLDLRTTDILLALSGAYASEKQDEMHRFERERRDEYHMSVNLLSNPDSAQGELSFLAGTRVRAAYLGLWQGALLEDSEPEHAGESLELTGSYAAAGTDLLPLGSVVTVESFPPSSLISLADPSSSEITIVLPVRTATKNWGMLALVGPLETTLETGRDSYFQCTTLLSVSLEQGQMLASLRSKQEQLRSSEERYALAASATNDGLWDWDLVSNSIYFSPRWMAMVGCQPDDVGTSPDVWFDRVHPDDKETLDSALQDCRSGRSTALASEHRLRASDGSYRLFACQALAIPGAPIRATRLVGSITDITDQRDLENQLRHRALHDALTGLPNRELVLDRTEQMLAGARRSHGSVSVLYLDLDNFKDVNDGFGHAAGDDLLVAVAARLHRLARDCDTVGRLGGDEFIVLLDSSATPEAPDLLAERIRDVLHAPFRLGAHEYHISASIGSATSNNGAAEDLLQEADVAMYQAKVSGKDRYVSFRPRMAHAVQTRLELEMDLAAAITGGELRIHYQPIFNLADREICAMEALVRWQHPRRGLLAPIEFLPVAEASGRLIIDLGKFVLGQACNAAAEWNRQGVKLDVAINMSTHQLEYDEVVGDVALALEQSGLDPARLVLEVTETAMMHSPDVIVERMGALKSLGVRLAIDDFGTGYSSLSSLRRFPVDILKIDRSFVESIAKSPEDASVVQTLVALGRNLSLEVVAEGVELESQLDAVQEAGCDSAQGFLLSRPLEPEKLHALMAALAKTGYRSVS